MWLHLYLARAAIALIAFVLGYGADRYALSERPARSRCPSSRPFAMCPSIWLGYMTAPDAVPGAPMQGVRGVSHRRRGS